MTRHEFSDQFDLLYNNITSNQAPGLDNYEKSVFLTKAQDEIVKSYFNPRLNKSVEGFDGNEKRQIDFSMIMRTNSIEAAGNRRNPIIDNKDNTTRLKIDKDIMMFINEFADVKRDGRDVRLVVNPMGYLELTRLSNRPYKRPTQYQAWRLLDNAEGENNVELIIGANDTLKKYTYRYLKKPYPIILEPLEGVSINGKIIPYGIYKSAINKTEDLYKEKLKFFVKDQKVYYYPSPSTIEEETFIQAVKENIVYESEYTEVLQESGRGFVIGPINSENHECCELDPILHEEILQRAVELAKATYQGTLDSVVSVGNASATNIGIVPQARQQQQ